VSRRVGDGVTGPAERIGWKGLSVAGLLPEPGATDSPQGTGTLAATVRAGSRAALSRPGCWLWGGLGSLAGHGLVLGLVLALGGVSAPPCAAPPPVVLDVVFGTPAGDGGPGDGARGAPGAPGSGEAERAALPAPVPAPPAPPVAAASTPVSPPAPPVRKKKPRRPPPPADYATTPSAPSPPAPQAQADAAGATSTAPQALAPGQGKGVAGAVGGSGGLGGGTGPGQGGQGSGPGAGGQGGGGYDGDFGTGNGPAFARQVRPEYPSQARRFGREGEVVLRLRLDAAGTLLGAEVVKGAGGGFDAAALAAVRASTYRPARLNGRTVPSRAVLRIRFQLSGR